MNWFYESAGQQQGPISEQEFERLIAEGKITPDTLVWREGQPDWQPLRIVRPPSSAPGLPPEIPTGGVPAGYVRCSLTGKVIPESEAIYIQGKPYSAEAKPQVLHSLQSGGNLPSENDANRTGPAWERRNELGVVTAAWETVKALLMEPSANFSTMKREGGLTAPLTFHLLLGSLAGIFIQLCIFAIAMSGVAAGNPALEAQASTSVGGLLLNIILVPIQILIGAFLGAGITHVCLMVVGGAKQPFETTFRVVNYANGAVSALYFIPLCGWVVGPIWGFVLSCIGLARAHEITTGKAVLAVFLPLIVCCGIAIIFAVTAGVIGAASQSGAVPQ